MWFGLTHGLFSYELGLWYESSLRTMFQGMYDMLDSEPRPTDTDNIKSVMPYFDSTKRGELATSIIRHFNSGRVIDTYEKYKIIWDLLERKEVFTHCLTQNQI